MAEQSPLLNGVKVATEALIAPGSSLILDGNIRTGAVHVVGGLLARAVIGPIGWGLIAANSFSKSVTDKHLHEHFTGSSA